MRPYRIKHIPTGLYYKPSTRNNLSKNGKIYNTNNCVLAYHKNDPFITIAIMQNTTLDKQCGKLSDNFGYNSYGKIFYKVPRTEFEIEWV